MKGDVPDKHLGNILLDIKNFDWPLVISFAGLGDEFEFRKTFSSLEANVIYIRDLSHNWYLNGIPDVGESVNEICDYFINKIKQYNPNGNKVITIGASAGGFAAILFGSLIDVNQAVAFSPQSFMDKFHRTLYYDYRWKDRVKQIYGGVKTNRQYLDVKPFVKNFSGNVDLFYDKNHRLDYLHGRRIRYKNVIHFQSKNGGHNLVRELRDSGKLIEYIESIIKIS
jgi:hypothetical protein